MANGESKLCKIFIPFVVGFSFSHDLPKPLNGIQIRRVRFHIWNILNKAHIKPHKVKMWQHSPDPEFKKEVQKIVDLYSNKKANVWCIDEKTGIQAIERVKWMKKKQMR